MKELTAFWKNRPEDLFKLLETSPNGLSSLEASRRLHRLQNHKFHRPEGLNALLLFLAQFKNPLVLILVFAVTLSAVLGEMTNAIFIFSILLLTGVFGFWQKYKADRAVKKLQALVHTSATVKRDGGWQKILFENVVAGDLVKLAAGDLVAGDCLLLSAKDLHVNESFLTGESFPAEKHAISYDSTDSLDHRANAIFQGSSVVNGEAEALVVKTGTETELGEIAESLNKVAEETAFDKGINRFGYMLVRLTFLLATSILLLNLIFHKPIIASILFALALAVGLAPELLPAIMVTTLSAGAERMAKQKVIVKKLSSIQNLGGVNIFCSDKTGTLTSGEVKVHSTVGLNGQHSQKVKLYAWLNAIFETGFSNPLDEALRQLFPSPTFEAPQQPVSQLKVSGGFTKFDEVPYDFIRKRLSIVVEKDGRHILITKGALQNVLEVCGQAEDEQGNFVPISSVHQSILENYKARSTEGFRTIGLAWKDITGDPVIDKDDEQDLIFLGFIFLHDPPKAGILQTVKGLDALGVRLKIITGDNQLVARHVGRILELKHLSVLTGQAMQHISDEALPAKALKTDIFAEIEPHQKERLIRALRNGGNVVAYLGDGINDASALRAADVGISVDSAVDVAKEASDMILLEKNLDVLRAGILEGRKTYLNTLKYIFITTSANFGNMFSLAGISLFLPFLPLLPQQILLLNFLSDIPALGIAGDQVDEEMLNKPKRWNVQLIRRFMMVFGIQSSLFDYMTFGLLLFFFHVNEAYFQTSWFIESVLTELLILLIIRTTRPVLQSRPSRILLWTILSVALLVLTFSYLPLAEMIGFSPLPLPLLGAMISIAVMYGIVVEVSKTLFFRKFQL